MGPAGTVQAAQGGEKRAVGLLSCCVMRLMQGPTMEATVRVLNRNGCDVIVPLNQGCCGALNAHAGDLDTTRSMARTNIDALMAAGVERVITASAGCGSTMKEYAEFLQDDPEYSAKAARFVEMTQDVTEFLACLPFQAPTAEIHRKVTYLDPCHLAHSQPRTDAPPQIVHSITETMPPEARRLLAAVRRVEGGVGGATIGPEPVNSTANLGLNGLVLTLMLSIRSTRYDRSSPVSALIA